MSLAVPPQSEVAQYRPFPCLNAWLRPLFGEVARVERGVAVVLLVVAGTGLSLLRQVGAPALDTIWAEDGSIFFTEALALPAWQSITHPYAGYLHVWPRVVAEAATALPVSWTAAVLALAAAGLAAALGALCFVATGGHLRSVAARVCIALSVTLAPTAGFEVSNSVALLQFPLTFAVFWTLLWRPRGWAGVVVACLTALAGTLSAPLTVALVPLAVARLLALASWRERAPALVFLAGAAAQLAVALSQPIFSQTSASLGEVTSVLLVRVALATVAGTELARELWHSAGLAAAVGTGVTLVLLGAYALGRPGLSRHARLLAAVTGAYAVGLAVLPIWLRGPAGMGWTADATPLAGARYAYVPILLIVCLAAIALDGRPRTVPAGWWRGLRVIALITLMVPIAADLRVPNLRSEGPRWSAQVHQAAAACRDLDSRAIVKIDHPPAFGDFFATVPCARL